MSEENEPWSKLFGITLLSGFFGGMIWFGISALGINYVGKLFEILGGDPNPPATLFSIIYQVIVSILHGLIIPPIRKEFFSAVNYIYKNS